MERELRTLDENKQGYFCIAIGMGICIGIAIGIIFSCVVLLMWKRSPFLLREDVESEDTKDPCNCFHVTPPT